MKVQKRRKFKISLPKHQKYLHSQNHKTNTQTWLQLQPIEWIVIQHSNLKEPRECVTCCKEANMKILKMMKSLTNHLQNCQSETFAAISQEKSVQVMFLQIDLTL